MIPMFNVGQYVGNCIESIMRQSISDIEIILVDDGSTDDSLDVCRRYEEKYPNVRTIRQNREGVSVARNTGVQAAEGKYICFIDADDFYIEDFAADFYERCEADGLDIIRGIYSIYDEEKEECLHINRRNLSYYDKVLSGTEFLVLSIKERANEVVPWLGFFRREFLLDNDIAFPKGIGYEEDQVYFLKALLQKPCRIMQVRSDFYVYRRRKGSATKTPTLKQARDVVAVVNMERRLIDGVTDKDVRRHALKYTSSSFYQLTSIYGRVPKSDQKEIRAMCPLGMKLMCAIYAANRHQRIKNVMFLLMPHVVALIYDLRR